MESHLAETHASRNQRSRYLRLLDDLTKNDGSDRKWIDRKAFYDEIATIFTPEAGIKIAANADGCIMADSPTLADIAKEYGSNAPIAWLSVQIADASMFSNSKEVMSEDQGMACAYIIFTKFFYLKLTEILLFFVKFKAGDYEKFYGSVASQKIIISIRSFLSYRSSIMERHERKKKESQKEDTKTEAVSWQRYCEIRKLKYRDYSPIEEILASIK